MFRVEGGADGCVKWANPWALGCIPGQAELTCCRIHYPKRVTIDICWKLLPKISHVSLLEMAMVELDEGSPEQKNNLLLATAGFS